MTTTTTTTTTNNNNDNKHTKSVHCKNEIWEQTSDRQLSHCDDKYCHTDNRERDREREREREREANGKTGYLMLTGFHILFL